jgi:hypothetical protein
MGKADPRIVDQDVQPSEKGVGLLDHPLRYLRIGEVPGDHAMTRPDEFAEELFG